MSKSKIEWTDETDNVFVVEGGGWYCEKVSEGCEHCYAERLNGTSYYGGNGLKYRQTRNGRPNLTIRRDILAGWARKTVAKKRFINSMTDTFGEFIPDEWIFELLDAMVAAPRQTYQVLTKRAERMSHVTAAWLKARGLSHVPPHIWMMVSAENQKRLDERAPWLLRLPAVRGLSLEPLLGTIDLSHHARCRYDHNNDGDCHLHPQGCPPAIHWAVAGGESGPEARPMHPNDARLLRDQCVTFGIPFLFKQWGEWLPAFDATASKCFMWADGEKAFKVGKHAAGRLLDGREWNEFPHREVA